MNAIGKLVFMPRDGHQSWPVGVYADTVEAFEHSRHLMLCGDKAANDSSKAANDG